MTGLDIFAWVVLLVLVVSTIGVLCIAGWLPGHIAARRNHPWAEAVKVAGWVTMLFGFVLWPLAFIWAYVDTPKGGASRDDMPSGDMSRDDMRGRPIA